jgi:hypothetical protein
MLELKNNKKLIIALIFIGLAVVIAGYQFFQGKSGVDLDQKIWMVCKSCGEQFQITTKAYSDFVAKNENSMGMFTGAGYICSKCGKPQCFVGEKCEKCGNVFIQGSAGKSAFPDQCPKCGYSKHANK